MNTIDNRLNIISPSDFQALVRDSKFRITTTWSGSKRFALPGYTGTISFNQLIEFAKKKYESHNFTDRYLLMRNFVVLNKIESAYSDWRIIRAVSWILSKKESIPFYRFVTGTSDPTANIADLMAPEIKQAQEERKEAVSCNMQGLGQPLKQFLISKGIRNTEKDRTVAGILSSQEEPFQENFNLLVPRMTWYGSKRYGFRNSPNTISFNELMTITKARGVGQVRLKHACAPRHLF